MQKPDSCQGCPLYEKGQGFVPDKVAPNATYAMIGEAPGKQELVLGEPFIGKAGFVLKSWLIRAVPLLRLADEKKQITYGNTLRCLPPEFQGRAYPRGEERLQAEAHCRQYDTPQDTVHTVVLFGESPQRAFFKEELDHEDATSRQIGHDLKGVMGRIGREYVKDGKRYVFAPHPAFILRQPSLVQHGQMALGIAANTETVMEPEYLPWDVALDELL